MWVCVCVCARACVRTHVKKRGGERETRWRTWREKERERERKREKERGPRWPMWSPERWLHKVFKMVDVGTSCHRLVSGGDRTRLEQAMAEQSRCVLNHSLVLDRARLWGSEFGVGPTTKHVCDVMSTSWERVRLPEQMRVCTCGLVEEEREKALGGSKEGETAGERLYSPFSHSTAGKLIICICPDTK